MITTSKNLGFLMMAISMFTMVSDLVDLFTATYLFINAEPLPFTSFYPEGKYEPLENMDHIKPSPTA